MPAYYIGNIDYTVTDDDLIGFLQKHGVAVKSAAIVVDRETQRPRGFGFVDVVDPVADTKAMLALDGVRLAGRKLRIRAKNADRAKGAHR